MNYVHNMKINSLSLSLCANLDIIFSCRFSAGSGSLWFSNHLASTVTSSKLRVLCTVHVYPPMPVNVGMYTYVLRKHPAFLFKIEIFKTMRHSMEVDAV